MIKTALQTNLIVLTTLLLPITLNSAETEKKVLLVKEAMYREAHADLHGMRILQNQLIRDYPNENIGYLLKLNSAIGRFSWDINNSELDSEIQNTAEKILSVARESSQINRAESLLASGQAYFALSYLKAVRGSYLQASTNGSKGIKDLEQALFIDPTLLDAKLHLGAAYYFAANLPPFIKVLSNYVWFIPSGDEEMGLLYLEEVAGSDSSLRIVAKYMLSSFLLRGSSEAREQATAILEELIKEFPENGRFYLRQISQLAESGKYEETLSTIQRFLTPSECCIRLTRDIAFAQVWKSVALLHLGQTKEAEHTLSQIGETAISKFPNWGRIWYWLISAKTYDKLGERNQAVQNYTKIITASETTLVPSHLLASAFAGLENPSPNTSFDITTYE